MFPGTTINVERPRLGRELSGKFVLPAGRPLCSVAYTYLDAYDLTTNTAPPASPPQQRRSRLLQGVRSALHDLAPGCSSSVTRLDVNALTFATVEDPNYSVVRVFASYKLTPAPDGEGAPSRTPSTGPTSR